MPDPAIRTVSIVLPVHRQREHIAELLIAYDEELADLGVQIEFVCVVNDSPDGSAGACRAAATSVVPVVVELAEGGWGRAVRAGLSRASGDLLVYTNSARTSAADLRYAIELGLANPTHVIKAERRFRERLLRRVGSVLYNLEVRALFGLASWDVNGTPKVFPRQFAPLLALQEDGDLIDAEFLVTCQRKGYRVLDFPVASVRRHTGRSTTGIVSAIRMYAGAFELRRRLR